MTRIQTASASPSVVDKAPYDLADRYRSGSGEVLLTGVQAIARLLVEQHQRDARAGRSCASFVSGYQGSPLGGLDLAIAGIPELASDSDVRLVPGVNEELGATAVWGSQLELPEGTPTHDGVVGWWYGKAPGVDRASDALRHANMFGANPKGGAIVLAGDDPACKSSSIPCASEGALAAMHMPVYYPRNAEEMVSFGLHAVALSRLSGCLVALKIVSDVADGLFTLEHDFADLNLVSPDIEWNGRPWTYQQRRFKDPRDSVLAEAELFGPRWEMVRAFNSANSVDEVTVDSLGATIGLVAAGTAYDSTRQALRDLGFSDVDLEELGIRVLRLGMVNPVDVDRVRDFAAGLETVLVVEDKSPFLEGQVREALYRCESAPRVLGKRDGQGRPLIPADGELTATRLAAPLRHILGDRVKPVATGMRPRVPLPLSAVNRSAYFCSGCPHNRSTVVPEGSLAGGGIGCHSMVTITGRSSDQVTGLTQMGGEGAQWIGQSAYTDVPHIFQNVGDGTFFHSGQLAVQACVAAGVNITYKILYNGAVAMTGAQDPQGARSVPDLARKLMAEGVSRVIVCAEEPQRYRRRRFPRGVTVWHRDHLDEAQKALRETAGVTVLIYDSRCAADARRLRKRGKLPERATRVVINEAVCEGCGDCGVKSNCLSVQPVDTEFGRKTRIDQNSCNTDYSCLDGDCPSFITLTLPKEGGRVKSRKTKTIAPPDDLESPPSVTVGTKNIFLAGIGGTGIVTVNQVLATAAMRADLKVRGLDQTGLSQKAGPVTSHLRIGFGDLEPSNRVSADSADCILAFDLLTATDPKYLGVADGSRTVSIASTSVTPTGDMVYDPSVRHPDESTLMSRLSTVSRQIVSFDALRSAQALLGGTAAANFLIVGAAHQSGALPIPAEAIEEAITINGVAVSANIAAFRWGRTAVARRETFDAAVASASGRSASRTSPTAPEHLFMGSTMVGTTRAIAERRAAHLMDYQGEETARRYLGVVESAWTAERRVGDSRAFSEAVAEGMHKFIAYKDEYEVARLLTDPSLVAAATAEVPGGGKLTYRLHPPTLRALGMGKVGFGPATHGVLRLVGRARRLRGTPLDVFGYARVRRIERTLRDHYEAMIGELGRSLDEENYEVAVKAAAAADIVRGYESVKLRNVSRYIETLAALPLPTSVPTVQLDPESLT